MNKNETFIRKAKEVHGERYEYRDVEYVNASTPVKIRCSEHGEFKQTPSKHLMGRGCHACGGTKKYDTETFIRKAKEVHGERYDYSTVDYKAAHTKVTIICDEHGRFEQHPASHLAGAGCPRCGGSFRRDTETFIRKAKEVHGERYGYSFVDYKSAHDKVKIICSDHGEFEQTPNNHLRGQGCPSCATLLLSEARKWDAETIVERGREIHGESYEYVVKSFETYNKEMTIVCPKHGEFKQTLNNHFGGKNRCPSCSNRASKGESELVEFLKEYFDVVTRCRSTIAPLELDIVIPSMKVAIEFNGIYWHSDKFLDKNYHLDKTERCRSVGYRLIHVFEDEWSDNKELIKKKILHILGKNDERVYARRCQVREVQLPEYRVFMDKNHTQGFIGASSKLGLYHDGELVSCLSLRSLPGEGNFDLVRYASSVNVVGGFSKLLTHFKRNSEWRKIVTYADRRWSEGDLYLKNGFIHIHNTPPNYFYVKQLKRFSRQMFQKSKLNNRLNVYDQTLSERDNMRLNGYMRLYDCGHMKFEVTNSD